jgi:hypothetical protein
LPGTEVSAQIKDTDIGLSRRLKVRGLQVCGGAIDEIVADYARLKVKLETEGFTVAPDE